MDETLSALRQNHLFKGFSDDGIRIILAASNERKLSTGEVVFAERAQGESCFLLVAGAVSLSVFRDGVERDLDTLHAPNSFGELSLLHKGPRRMTCRAVSDVVLLEITRQRFSQMQQQRPQACLKFLMNVVEEVGKRLDAAGASFDRLLS